MINKILFPEMEKPDTNKLINQGWAKKYSELVGYDGKKVEEFFGRNLLGGDYEFQGLIGKMDMELGHIEIMEQKMAKHFGINFHYPYINEELAEYCYKLPDNLKIRNGITKWGFRKICMKYLPAIMKDRAKIGGPVAPVNFLMGWNDLDTFDKNRYLAEQKKILK